MNKGIIVCILLLICLSTVHAAVLQGTVYDDNLIPMKNVLVEVDSSPVQRLLAPEGKYMFNLLPGTYTVKVKAGSGLTGIITEEKAVISKEGTFTIDLFVFPNIEENDTAFDTTNTTADILDIVTEKKNDVYRTVLFLIVLLVIMLLIKRKYLQKRKQAENNKGIEPDTDELLKKMNNAGGRMTQKELRKAFPFSEAKMSLMITELEAKGKIEKIKKGRGNVLIVKK